MDIKINFLNFSHVHVECEDGIFYELRDYFSFEAENYRFNPKFKQGVWDGRIRLLDYNRKLPYGLVNQIKKFADQFGYSFWIDPQITEKEEISREEFDKWVESKEIYSGNTRITPHWYQSDAVYEGLVNRRKILNLPTSAGKSLIQALLARYYLENYEGKVLILVPTTALVDQMINDFVDYRLFPREACLGIRSGTKRDSDAMIYVSTYQTAVKQPKEWFEQFGQFMNDECHMATGKSISTVIEGLTNCMFKFGLSGSLRDGKANLMQYMGLFGELPYVHPLPVRNSAYIWCGWWVMDEIQKMTLAGQDWKTDDPDSPYYLHRYTLQKMITDYPEVDVQESRNGRVIHRTALEAGIIYDYVY